MKDTIKIQSDIFDLALAIGNFDRSQNPASIDQSNLHAMTVAQAECGDLAAVFRLAEWFALDGQWHGVFR